MFVMSKSWKLQVDAMNNAIERFAANKAEEKGLSAIAKDSLRQRVLYGEAYNKIEVYKSGQLYSTMLKISNDIITRINETE